MSIPVGHGDRSRCEPGLPHEQVNPCLAGVVLQPLSTTKLQQFRNLGLGRQGYRSRVSPPACRCRKRKVAEHAEQRLHVAPAVHRRVILDKQLESGAIGYDLQRQWSLRRIQIKWNGFIGHRQSVARVHAILPNALVHVHDVWTHSVPGCYLGERIHAVRYGRYHLCLALQNTFCEWQAANRRHDHGNRPDKHPETIQHPRILSAVVHGRYQNRVFPCRPVEHMHQDREKIVGCRDTVAAAECVDAAARYGRGNAVRSRPGIVAPR